MADLVPINMIDAKVGQRIRTRRGHLGLPRWVLAQQLGVMPVEIKLYETGARRVPPAYLIQLTRSLGVPLPYFFDGSLARPRPRLRSAPKKS